MGIHHFHLLRNDDPVLRNQNMAFLLQNGPLCNAVFWRTRNRCVGLPAITEFPMRQYAAFFSLFARKTLGKFFSLIHVLIVPLG